LHCINNTVMNFKWGTVYVRFYIQEGVGSVQFLIKINFKYVLRKTKLKLFLLRLFEQDMYKQKEIVLTSVKN
jgi:hypothetical protein